MQVAAYFTHHVTLVRYVITRRARGDMFNTLLESKAKTEVDAGGKMMSIVLHTVLILLAVLATANAGQKVIEQREEKVEFLEVKQDEPPPPEPETPKEAPPPDAVAAPPPPKGFQVLTAPVDIPTVIPDIDLTREVTREEDFSGRGVQGGIASGVVGGTGVVQQDQPYFDFQVEKVAMAAPGNTAPRYPDVLRSANQEGTVLVTFVVDTNGRADMSTFRVIESPHDLFTDAVRKHLPSMRYYPAETGGRKVKMWVQQPFSFTLAR